MNSGAANEGKGRIGSVRALSDRENRGHADLADRVNPTETSRRVLSVSAADTPGPPSASPSSASPPPASHPPASHPPASHPPPGPAPPVTPATPVFVTPRVVDQRGFDELAGRLRDLLGEADGVLGRLRDRIHEARECDRAPVRSSGQLQDRLRLGARMLQAFQGQIDRAQGAIDEMTDETQRLEAARRELTQHLDTQGAELDALRARAEATLEAAVAAMERRLDTRLEERAAGLPRIDAVERDLKALVRDALERLDTHAASLEGGLGKRFDARFDEAGVRLHEMEQRMDVVVQLIETAEVNAAALAHRVAVTTRQLEETRQATDERLERADAAATKLAAGVRHAEDTLAAECMATRLAPADEASRRLEALLDRLRPWEQLLGEAERSADGLPESIARIMESLRSGIGKDMANLSLTMRELADRVERFGETVPEAPAIPEPPATPETREPPATPEPPAKPTQSVESKPMLQLRRRQSSER